MGDSPLMAAMKAVIFELKFLKTDERTPRQRYLAIAITEAEKLIAFLAYFVDGAE